MISVIIDGGGKCHAVWHGGKLNDMLLAILREADVINIKPAIVSAFNRHPGKGWKLTMVFEVAADVDPCLVHHLTIDNR